MKKRLLYYIKSSVRRQLLDSLYLKNSAEYKGIVLDIGGRDRGYFKKPKDKVEKWIFADIESKHNPDIILDIANMSKIITESIDVINAAELFEHVEKIETGLKECYRVLKFNGKIIISVPFLFQVHADPFDFQRWTNFKWKMELEKLGFKIEKLEVTGRFFFQINHLYRTLAHSLPFGIKHFLYLFFPFFDLLMKLDSTKSIENHRKLGNFHGGYFIIAKKIQNEKYTK